MNNLDEILSKYTSGEADMASTNAALAEAGAAFHLASMTDEERAEKRRQEDAIGYLPGDRPPLDVPEEIDRKRRMDLIGKPANARFLVQHTRHGDFLCEYDDDGYYIKSIRLPEGGVSNV